MTEPTLKEKIKLMLEAYRAKLVRAHDADPYHTDYVEGVRLMAIIGVLENLDYYAKHEAEK